MFSVVYTVRDNKGNKRDHIHQMEEDKYKKVIFITTLQQEKT